MQRPGAWVSRRCFEQEGLNLAGARERVVDTVDVEEDRGGEGAVQEETTCRS